MIIQNVNADEFINNSENNKTREFLVKNCEKNNRAVNQTLRKENVSLGAIKKKAFEESANGLIDKLGRNLFKEDMKELCAIISEIFQKIEKDMDKFDLEKGEIKLEESSKISNKVLDEMGKTIGRSIGFRINIYPDGVPGALRPDFVGISRYNQPGMGLDRVLEETRKHTEACYNAGMEDYPRLSVIFTDTWNLKIARKYEEHFYNDMSNHPHSELIIILVTDYGMEEIPYIKSEMI